MPITGFPICYNGRPSLYCSITLYIYIYIYTRFYASTLFAQALKMYLWSKGIFPIQSRNVCKAHINNEQTGSPWMLNPLSWSGIHMDCLVYSAKTVNHKKCCLLFVIIHVYLAGFVPDWFIIFTILYELDQFDTKSSKCLSFVPYTQYTGCV